MHLYSPKSVEDYKVEEEFHSKLSSHPNILKLSDHFLSKHEGDTFGVIEMEKMDTDLFNIISSGEYTEMRVKKHIFREICKGVKYMHHKGYAHLDLKPENILLRIPGTKKTVTHNLMFYKDEHLLEQIFPEVKIADFGLCKSWDKKKNKCAAYVVESQRFFGTLEYSAPEMRNKESSRVVYLDKVDVFALGVLLFALITGSFPFIFSEEGELISIKKRDCISKFCSDAPLCTNLISKLMNETPDLRPSMDEVLDHPWLSD